MSSIVITVSQTDTINFNPQTTIEEIAQNVRTILTTPKFSVPLDRDFGVDATIIDKPIPVAQAKMSAEIFNALKKYEPRVSIKKISWTAGLDGILTPKVEVIINES